MSAPRRLLIPAPVWAATTRLLVPYTAQQVEAGLYWYGVRQDDVALVSLAGIPAQMNRPRNFEVPADSLAALVRVMPEPLVVVAALHTHPGQSTRHSEWDDERAVSQKILSIVLPFYGREAALGEAGVHECVDGRWQFLEASAARSRIALLPTTVDARR